MENDIKRLGKDEWPSSCQDAELERALEEDIVGRVWIVELAIYLADDCCLQDLAFVLEWDQRWKRESSTFIVWYSILHSVSYIPAWTPPRIWSLDQQK